MHLSKANLEELRSKYPYSTKFEAIATTLPIEEEVKQSAIASLDSLAGIFDDEIAEKIRSNPDLLYITSNLIHANHANLNDDCILLEDLEAVKDLFKDKFIDREHRRSDGAFGAICSVGYSNFDNNEIIADISSADSNKIQLVIGGYLWRLIDKELCEAVEESSALGDKRISTSFEILFDDYWIGVGPTRNITDARIIVPQDREFNKYNRILRVNGGEGKENNNLVFRILKGGILPVGAGIVAKPASGIKGVLAITSPSQLINNENEEQDEDDEPNELDHEKINQSDLQEIEKNINSQENSVNANIASNLQENNKIVTNMEIELKSFDDLSVKWTDLVKLEASASINNIRKFIEEKIVDESKKYAEELKVKEGLLKTVEASKMETENKLKEVESVVSELKKQLDEINSAKAAAEAEATFNTRMGELDEVFDLDNEDRAILVDEVKEIETDEAFAKWMDKKKVLMKEKTKSYKKAQSEKMKGMHDKMKETMCNAGLKIEKFEVDESTLEVKEVIASLKEDENQSIPNSSPATKNFKESFAAAFGEGIEVGGVKAKDFLTKTSKK